MDKWVKYGLGGIALLVGGLFILPRITSSQGSGNTSTGGSGTGIFGPNTGGNGNTSGNPNGTGGSTGGSGNTAQGANATGQPAGLINETAKQNSLYNQAASTYSQGASSTQQNYVGVGSSGTLIATGGSVSTPSGNFVYNALAPNQGQVGASPSLAASTVQVSASGQVTGGGIAVAGAQSGSQAAQNLALLLAGKPLTAQTSI